MNAEYWINKLRLEPHPEGGYFSEVYRSSEKVPEYALHDRFSGDRSFSTSIYYLLQSGEFSSLHRIKSDEIWHFYSGSPLKLVTIDESGNYKELILGTDHKLECFPQIVIPFGVWFGAAPVQPDSYTLAGCTVAPGFDFADFEMGDRNQLFSKFPQHIKIIADFTRPQR